MKTFILWASKHKQHCYSSYYLILQVTLFFHLSKMTFEWSCAIFRKSLFRRSLDIPYPPTKGQTIPSNFSVCTISVFFIGTVNESIITNTIAEWIMGFNRQCVLSWSFSHQVFSPEISILSRGYCFNLPWLLSTLGCQPSGEDWEKNIVECFPCSAHTFPEFCTIPDCILCPRHSESFSVSLHRRRQIPSEGGGSLALTCRKV